MLIYVNKREKMKHFFLFMLILCQFISISQSDRRTDVQAYQIYSSETHNINHVYY